MTNIKMGVQEFGDRLIETGDLDPLYIGLVGARAADRLEEAQLARWLLAYWCFYHVGAASRISEETGDDYWHWMGMAALNDPAVPPSMDGLPGDRWPRAAERRHFRGEKCVRAVEWLRTMSMGVPEAPVRSLVNMTPPPVKSPTDKEVMAEVQRWPMFGPWVAFKAADMLERVWGLPITFDRDLGLMYKEPRAGLELLSSEQTSTKTHFRGDNAWWYNKLLLYFSPRPAPPARARIRRTCGPQEVETVLCKWKSYTGGHYHLGKDIHEQRAALAGWGDTALAIARAYPPEVPRG